MSSEKCGNSACASPMICAGGRAVASGRVALGDRAERVVRLRAGIGVLEGLGGSEARGEEPEQVAEVAREHAALPLGADVDDGLGFDRRAGPDQPTATTSARGAGRART